jgi:TonB family protein
MKIPHITFAAAAFLTSVAAAAPPTDLSRPAEAKDGRIWDSDYPRRAIIDRANGAVVMRMEIDPTGKVYRCKIVERSGVVALDDYSCKIVIVRFRFDAARDQSGQKVWDVRSQRINWKLKAKDVFQLDYFDYTLKVKQLPQNASSASVRLSVLVDPKGVPSGCRVQTSSGFPAVDRSACLSLLSAGALLPVLNEQGEPTTSMQTLWLKFSAESEAAGTN